MDDVEAIIRRASEELGCFLDDEAIGRFLQYHKVLTLWNRRISLIAEKGPLDIPVKHFIDSLTALPFIHPETRRLLDIGSGAGLPGIPLKIARPELLVSLLEPTGKKTSFLKEALRKLSLEGLEVLQGRSDDPFILSNRMNSYDIVISRATFALKDIILQGHPYLRRRGFIIAMKGPAVDKELSEAMMYAHKKNLSLATVHRMSLPLLQEQRVIVVFTNNSS
ncbi:MAG: 16S rRNA (guanine(527)-N(7))-methyltransferase RsmG [Deltaproteobacteria bacterium]|nr:16S rRNA (guanine(527)-N(7))-methyltransferase RsmG [Deltaproteobacteria bacterium]